MSAPNPTNIQEELEQARMFLSARQMEFLDVAPGNNPPDVIVTRERMPPLEIEVTKYHPEEDRVGMELRASQIREALNGLIRQSPNLKGISVGVHYQDLRMPKARDHTSIASEIVRLIEYAVANGLVVEGNRKFCVVPDPVLNRISNFFFLPAADWPLLAKHVSVVYLSRFPFDYYLPSNNTYAQSGYCSPFPEAFQSIFSAKEAKIRRAIKHKTYARCDSPLILLIPCNIRGDQRSYIYGSDLLRDSVEECGFDFASSHFDEIWLMDLCGGGRSQCLYPWESRSMVAAPPHE